MEGSNLWFYSQFAYVLGKGVFCLEVRPIGFQWTFSHLKMLDLLFGFFYDSADFEIVGIFGLNLVP